LPADGSAGATVSRMRIRIHHGDAVTTITPGGVWFDADVAALEQLEVNGQMVGSW
jgi:hypothetical protein